MSAVIDAPPKSQVSTRADWTGARMIGSSIAGAGVATLLALHGEWFGAGAVAVLLCLMSWAGAWLFRRRHSGWTTGRSIGWIETSSGMFQVFGWMASIAVGWQLAARLESALRQPMFGTALESLPVVLGSILWLGVIIAGGVLLQSVPRRLMQSRHAGRIDARDMEAALFMGAGSFFSGVALVGLIGAFAVLNPESPLMAWLDVWGGTCEAISALFICVLVTLIAYTIPIVRSSVTEGAGKGLWIVAATESAGSAVLPPIAELTRAWIRGPVSVLIPSPMQLFGDHIRIADAAGRLGSLFPKLEVEMGDWLRTLPPVFRWRSMPVREMHVAADLLPLALRRCAAPGDAVIVLLDDSRTLPRWAESLRGFNFAIGWIHSTVPMPALDGHARNLSGARKAIRQHVEELLERPEFRDRNESTSPTSSVDEVSPRSEAMSPEVSLEPEIPPVSESTPRTSEPQDAESPVPDRAGAADDSEINAHVVGAVRPPLRVFISYCTEYRHYLDVFVPMLEREEIEVLWDRKLVAGDDWAEVLDRMLEDSQGLVAVVGSVTEGRESPIREIRRAIELGKLLLPVFVNPPSGPKEVLEYQAANADGSQVHYLEGLQRDELERVLRNTANRVREALNRRIAMAANDGRGDSASVSP